MPVWRGSGRRNHTLNTWRTECGQRARRNRWQGGGCDQLNAGTHGRRKIYRSVGFIKGGFRGIGAWKREDADGRAQQYENQDETNSRHSTQTCLLNLD
jgi:hypothetical protein